MVNLWRLSSASSVPVYHSSVFPSNDEDLSGTGATADTGSFSLSAGMFTDATSGTAAEHEENDSDMLVRIVAHALFLDNAFSLS